MRIAPFVIVGGVLATAWWFFNLDSEYKGPVIDVHTHATFDGSVNPNSQIPVTKEEFLKQLKEAGVVAAVSHTDRNGKPHENLKNIHVIQCAGLTAKPDYQEIENGLKSGEYSCLKIYLGYVHQYANDKNYEPAYKLAEKYDVPVVFHTGDTYDEKGKLKYTDPLTIDEIAVDYPQVTFVIAHLGNPWIQTAAEVAYKNPNVYVEASALLIGNLNEIPEESLHRYVIEPLSWAFGYIENPEKIMFGTDWPLVNIKQYLDVYKRAIPREHWRKVFHDNAVKVFRLERALKKEGVAL